MTEDGDVDIRAKDPCYAKPGPEKVQKFTARCSHEETQKDGTG